MDTINYQHLRYFWVTAREGKLTAASKLTERGQVVKQYVDDIFALGEEMVDAVRRATGLRHAYRFRVGVGNDLPKLVAWELLSPALHLESFPVHLIVHEDRADRLVADLAVHHLDLVLADRPVGLSSDVHADSILLGESAVSLMASPALAAQLLNGFPQSLEGALVLLPKVGSAMRDLHEGWFHRIGIRPRVVGVRRRRTAQGVRSRGSWGLPRTHCGAGGRRVPVPRGLCWRTRRHLGARLGRGDAVAAGQPRSSSRPRVCSAKRSFESNWRVKIF